MLQTIRDRASGWFAYAIVFLISVPFALWGINHYFEGGGNNLAARVGGKPITLSAYQRAVREERARLNQIYGGQLPGNVNESMIKQAALRQLIQNTLLSQVVHQAGYKITNHELLKQIVSYPIFQKDGHFSKKQYKAVLANQGLQPSTFENHLRNQMAIDQFRSGVMNTAFITSSELNSVLKLKNEERELQIVDVPITSFLKNIDISSKEVEQYYKKHKSQYMTHRRIKLSYLELNMSDIKKTISPDNKTLKKFYKKNINRYLVPERAKAAEIVIHIPDKKGGKTKTVGLANHIVKLYKQGRKFNALAHRYSESATANKGGSIGVVSRSDLPPSLSNILFSLHSGSISKPVIVGNKLYLLRVDRFIPSHTLPYSVVKTKVRKAYISDKASQEFKHQIDRLSELTYQHPGTLKPASESLGMVVQHTGWFSKQNGSGIASNPKIIHAAYSKTVIENGTNSALIQLSNNKAVVLRISGKQPPKPKPLNEVRSDIKKELERKSAEKKCKEVATKITDLLKKSSNAKPLLDKLHLTIHSAGWVKRNSQKLPSEIINAAFDVHVPEKNKPSVGKTKLDNGGYAVFRVKQIKWGNVSNDEKRKVDNNLTQHNAQIEMSILFQDLAQSSKIRVYKNNLNF